MTTDRPMARHIERAADLFAGTTPLRVKTARIDTEPDPDVVAWRAEALARRAAQLWTDAVPTRFRAARLDTLDPDVAHHVTEWANQPTTNLVLAGPVGVGKTWGAFAAVRGAVEQGSSLRFWPLVELLDALRPGGSADAWAAAIDTDLLIVDDLGAERGTEWSAERLYALVNRRWLEHRPIIATTNLSATDLREALGERSYSRLVGGAVIVRIAGADRRRTTTQGEPR